MILANHGIVSSSGGLPPSTLLNNLYAVYKAENNANDSLGIYNGTAQGGLTYVPGKVGTAFNFNGTNAYVQLGDVMDVGTSSWSYSMWFNAVDTSSSKQLFTKTYANIGLGRIRSAISSGKIIFAFSPETNAANENIIIQTNNSVLTNTWYHVVFILDRTNNLRIYLNGNLEPVTTTSSVNDLTPYPGDYNNNNPFRIGAGTAADNTSLVNLFNGSIDEFNVWNRVLTPTEITELYNAGTGKFYPY